MIKKSENLKNVVFHRPFWFRIFRVGEPHDQLPTMPRAKGAMHRFVTGAHSRISSLNGTAPFYGLWPEKPLFGDDL
uniref:Uncharacterized protein n=1 Tax=Candidatus Kentrum sp. UNK TaxID=2126344 RepID=A0A451AZU8_9GAMM|nr:MAG: hypothetical protein BECKUNK1418G_GA0071005_106912 [Candidatus Kentron sp. UNK]VFK71550.1 MAG: hypothetical protein BECKUNK1418H_GA0071006_107112 [Candidatus Kentron sp. UNK]